MVFAVICWIGTLAAWEPHIVRQDMAIQWVGQHSAKIEKMLGEGPTASMTAGGTDNLQIMRFYANAGLVVWYDSDGIAVRVRRAVR